MLGLQLEITMAEGINHQIADIPGRDAEDIQTKPMIEGRQQTEEPQLKDELLGKGERNCCQPTVQMALVMLPMNPMEPAYVKGPVRTIVPNLGPNGCGDKRTDE